MGLDSKDPGMMPDGAKCGDGKVSIGPYGHNTHVHAHGTLLLDDKHMAPDGAKCGDGKVSLFEPIF